MQMKASVIAALLASSAFCLIGGAVLSYSTRNKPIPADIDVTIDCTPRIDNMIIVEDSCIEFIPMLALKHRLVFDGLAFRSKIYLPAVESVLLYSGKDVWRWFDLDGEPHELGLDRKDLRWRIVSSGPVMSVSATSNQQTLTYFGTRLIKLQSGNHGFRFIYAGNRLQSVVTEEAQPREVLSLRSKDLVLTLATGSHRIVFKEDQLGSITSCTTEDSSLPLWSFGYEKGLLTSAVCRTARYNCRWGVVRVDSRVARLPMQPVIKENDRYQFMAEMLNSVLRVKYRRKTDDATGGWELFLLTGAFRSF
jgi:hypothetical protein